jgi:hypothetical protein
LGELAATSSEHETRRELVCDGRALPDHKPVPASSPALRRRAAFLRASAAGLSNGDTPGSEAGLSSGDASAAASSLKRERTGCGTSAITANADRDGSAEPAEATAVVVASEAGGEVAWCMTVISAALMLALLSLRWSAALASMLALLFLKRLPVLVLAPVLLLPLPLVWAAASPPFVAQVSAFGPVVVSIVTRKRDGSLAVLEAFLAVAAGAAAAWTGTEMTAVDGAPA